MWPNVNKPVENPRLTALFAERRQADVPAARPVHARAKAAAGRVTIGRDGKVHSRPSGSGTGRPVRRVNRQKRRG